MAHPLVGKYETTDLTALSPEDRVFARTEIKDALSGKSKAKLSPEDRVILLRLWMETFERATQPGAPGLVCPHRLGQNAKHCWQPFLEHRHLPAPLLHRERAAPALGQA